MQSWIIEIMNQFGYIGIIFLIAIENIFPPIPSEVILTFGGFMTTYSNLTAWGVVISATFGSLLGAIILYFVGSFLTPEQLGVLLKGKVGRLLRLKKEDIIKASKWFNSKGKITVLFCRCIPVVRSLISIPAGMAKMKMSTFCIMTIIGSFMWNIVLVYLGVTAGASWQKIVSDTDAITRLTVIILMIIVTIASAIFYKKRQKVRKSSVH